MNLNRARPFVLSLVLAGGLIPAAEPPNPPDPPPPPAPPPLPSVQDKAAASLNAGREAFAKGRYADALAQFREALALRPDSRHAQLLAGVAAYWNREPGPALEYWDKLLQTAPKGSAEEWELTRQRIPALFALGRFEDAELSVARLYELRREKLPAAAAAKGFTREHLWEGTRRAGAWEPFDERGEQARAWEFNIVETQGGQGAPQARLVVELDTRAEGGTGYALLGEGLAGRAAYFRWLKKPTYQEVRARVADFLRGKLPPLPEATGIPPTPEKPVAPAKTEPPTPEKPVAPAKAETPALEKPVAPAKAEAPTPEKAVTPAKTEPPAPEKAVAPAKAEPPAKGAAVGRKREFTPEEKGRMARAGEFKLPLGPTRILETAARLAEVQFDIGRFARLSLADPPAARAFEAAVLTGRYPYATEDATDLVRQITSSPPLEAAAAFEHLEEVLEGARSDYGRFALLTAINTRGGELPRPFLEACLKARDFVVRETAALLLARAGRPEGVKALFKELETAEAAEFGDDIARIISYPLEELLGPALGPCPAAGNADWRKNALAWWKERGGKLEYVQNSPPGMPAWRERK